MKLKMVTKTLEVCKKVVDVDSGEQHYVVKIIKGQDLFNCLSQVTIDVECMVADKELTSVDGILGRLHFTNYNGDIYDDYVLYIKDVTNKDYVFVDDNCIVDGRKCTDYEGR